MREFGYTLTTKQRGIGDFNLYFSRLIKHGSIVPTRYAYTFILTDQVLPCLTNTTGHKYIGFSSTSSAMKPWCTPRSFVGHGCRRNNHPNQEQRCRRQTHQHIKRVINERKRNRERKMNPAVSGWFARNNAPPFLYHCGRLAAFLT